jgi:hypothetical protein
MDVLELLDKFERASAYQRGLILGAIAGVMSWLILVAAIWLFGTPHWNILLAALPAVVAVLILIGLWNAAREQGKFEKLATVGRIIRKVFVGALFGTAAGVLVGVALKHFVTPIAWQLAVTLMALGAFIGGFIKLARQLKKIRKTGESSFGVLNRALENVWKGTEIARGVFGSLVLFVVGLAITAGLVWLTRWNWPPPPMPPTQGGFVPHGGEWLAWGVSWAAICVLGYLGWEFGMSVCWLALRDIIRALGKSKTLGEAEAHGRAALADEEQAASAARGRSGQVGTADLNLDY